MFPSPLASQIMLETQRLDTVLTSEKWAAALANKLQDLGIDPNSLK
jgi:hypothetical protein